MLSKIRTVKPELFRHEGLYEAEEHYQLPLRVAFIGLFTLCDREGRFRWQPRIIKLDILPYDAVDFGAILEALAASGFIVKYEHQGQSYGYIPTWRKHQCINAKERKSAHPNPHVLSSREEAAEIVPLTAGEMLSDETPPLSSPESTCLPVNSTEAHENYAEPHKNSSEVRVKDNATAITVDKVVNEINMFSDVLTLPEALTSHNSCSESLTNNSVEAIPDSGLTPHSQQFTCFHRNYTEVPMNYLGVHKKARGELELELEKELEVEEELELEKEGVWGRKNQSLAIDLDRVASEPRPLEVSTPLCISQRNAISDLFAHWQAALGHPNARLDSKRRKVISAALKFGYTPEELKQAISGCSVTPHNIGDNDRGQRYDGLQLILKDADQIDRFIANYFSPPRPKTPAQRHTENNMNALNNWAARKQHELEEEARREANQEVNHAA